MTRQPHDRGVERLLSTGRHLFSQGFGGLFGLSRAAAFAQFHWHKPVHVRVLQRKHEPTRAALAARFLARYFAMDQLGKPQRETLLPYATRTCKQERLRKLSGGVGARQFGLNPFVPDEGR